MKAFKVAGLAALVGTLLFCTPVYGARQFAVPSGSLVVGTGTASFDDYVLKVHPARGQGVLKLDAAGTVGPDVTIEVTLKLMPPYVGDAGIIYRTSNWGANSDTYGWYAGLMPGGVELVYGTNSSVPFRHRVAFVPARLIPNAWYKLRVVASGDNHRVYLNDQQVINVYDSHFGDVAGYAGLRVSGFSAAFKDVVIE
jgi:hypothetical protein